MDTIYLLMIVALALLAIADLIVGVSNDAVNFLNSAIGSKAVSFTNLMIVASLGIALGAIFSSGMMEVARKGIFNPGEFMFNEIMIIFMAVMITDILLLDYFNSVGMPTSTTVSIVFELLGAAVAMALIKIGVAGGDFSEIVNYINTSKATQIIFGILLSVVVAFSVGAAVQWVSRLLLSYDFEKKAKWVGAVFGGVALTAITYFILIKGIKGTPYAKVSFDIISGNTIQDFIENNVLAIVAVTSVFWSLFSYLLIRIFKTNIYKLIILVGTFALALAFAGNDLVNFIGVPIAAWQSYGAWVDSGLAANEFSMGVLASKVPTPSLLLFFAGMIMVVTLWFSSKAKRVVKTSIDLSSQRDTKERFEPNFLSRVFVRFGIKASEYTNTLIPNKVLQKIEKQFEPIEIQKNTAVAEADKPAFDMVRAAVNLMVASVLISIATSYKLPLSTTYVTFMVAMGTSLADKAWGTESAVYRVAGVLNVIAGWFFTAIIAFTAAATIAYLINISELMIAVLLFIAFVMLIKSSLKKTKNGKSDEGELRNAESSSIQGVIQESAKNVANVVKRSQRIYSNAIEGLAKQDLNLLKKNKRQVVKLSEEVNDLRDHIFYFIKNLDESSLGASNFYISLLGDLQDITQSLEYISTVSFKHVNNNHKKLKYNQIQELKDIDHKLNSLLNEISDIFSQNEFSRIVEVLSIKQSLFDTITSKIEAQITRTRSDESSPKNTTLYFSLLLESKDLINTVMSFSELYHNEFDASVKPATIKEE